MYSAAVGIFGVCVGILVVICERRERHQCVDDISNTGQPWHQVTGHRGWAPKSGVHDTLFVTGTPLDGALWTGAGRVPGVAIFVAICVAICVAIFVAICVAIFVAICVHRVNSEPGASERRERW